GPRLRFTTDAVIAVCGANLYPMADSHPLPMWRPVRVAAGTRVVFGRPDIGCRCYLAVAGGFDVDRVLGSQSTALLAGYGGFEGRALRKRDVLPLRSLEETQAARWMQLLSKHRHGLAFPGWSVSRHKMPYRVAPQPVRVLPGRHWQSFPLAVRDAFLAGEYRVGLDSDRMGYRLEGLELQARRGNETASESVVMGAVQVPPGGAPIVLMADRQTTGGYPIIAVVVGVDLPVVAQLAPGESLRFKVVSLEESYAVALAREQQMNRIRQALAARLF
ncbi:MAG: biotin-dependent carboxyltransferase, partial [Burkholderiales bacterium]|nr:biotin-dependent carboxyltransferase [Burkholderiales bacterium]